MKLLSKVSSFLSTKFFLRLYLLLIAGIMIMKMCGLNQISDGLTLGAMGFISVLIGLYTAEKKVSNKIDGVELVKNAIKGKIK